MSNPILKAILLLALLVTVSGIVSAQDFYGAQTRNATIAINTSLSGAVELTGCTMAAIVTPSAWTTANLTFQVSTDGSTFTNLWDEFASEVTVSLPTAAASSSITVRLSPADWWSVRWIRIRSGTSGTPVTQTAARTLKIVCR